MKILYIDPMSRKNLGIYGKNLLENINGEKYFFASEGFQFDKIKDTTIIFNYNYYLKRNIFKIISYIYSQFKLVKWILNNNPDIIHIQWVRLPIFDSIILFIVKKLRKRSKIVYTAHNALPHDSNNKLFLYQYYILYHLFDGIIVHINRTKQELINLFHLAETSIREIPHGTLEFDVYITEKRLYPDKTLFSMTGSMNYYKGVDILINAWISNKNLINDYTIHLIIAGASNIPLEKIPSNSNITIINRQLTDTEYQLIINSTDVGILPYRQISQSGVLLSLLTKHKPVIVSDCGGLTQPFNIGKVGWIIDGLSAETLSKTIQNVVQNKQDILNIQNDNILWNKIDNFYSWKNIGRYTMDFYNLVVNSPL